jgi:CubicO group peptidase (beta-lactamase class C family)
VPFRKAILIAGCSFAACLSSLAANYESAIRAVSDAAQAEVRAQAISGVTIALVADQEVVFVGGFGFANKQKRIPSGADTVYRAGSISKLFTAVSAMQLVEQDRLDIDKPVTNFLPEFRITVPFENALPVTLRQLMCHRSGMVRESPIGSYFDDSEPTMQKTVASLASCVLVHPPTTKTKYSNSGVTIVGAAVERVSGMRFEDYQRKHILDPLGMTNSAFLRNAQIRRRLAIGYLPVAQPDGAFHEIPAPVFELGTLSAGNLYTTAGDLTRFLQWLFAENPSHVLRRETLRQMFTPQLTTDSGGFGLGFSIGQFGTRKSVSHTGAVYGFTSSLTALPDEKIGVVVLCNDDIAVGPVRKVNNLALAEMVAASSGTARTNATDPSVSNAADLRELAGDYESAGYWARVEATADGGVLNYSGQKLALKPAGPLKFRASGRIGHDWPVAFERGADGCIQSFAVRQQKFRRVNPSAIPEPPAAWKKLVGSYGPGFIPLIISIRHGHLYAMTENEFDCRLIPVNEWVFNIPSGLYEDEQLVFQADSKGKVHTAVLANMPLRRR